ncbi:MAG: DUF2470 domain-containing protein [Actinomycetota bacterium]
MPDDFSADEKAGMIEHMNDDHRDACLLYAQHYLGLRDARSATMVEITRTSMTLAVDVGSGSTDTVTYSFDRSLGSVADAAAYLATLAYSAGGT